jgi:hypothetical protein
MKNSSFLNPKAAARPVPSNGAVISERSSIASERNQERSLPPGPTPQHIMEVGFGFGACKTLLAAVELGLFTELAKGSMDAGMVERKFGLHPRGVRDFLDALVALRFLERQDGVYFNTLETEHFLDRKKATYIGGLLEMANARLYGFWGSLTEALRTGRPQNEAKSGGEPFAVLYSDPERLGSFLKAMTGISLPAALAIAEKFPWREYNSFVDVGTAQGAVPVQLARSHPHLRGIGFDLPVVKPVFEAYVEENRLSARVQFKSGDFFKERLPEADVIVMGHILHDWNLEEKRLLLGKAYEVLPPGGALIVYEALIDDGRRENAFGLIMSLNMLIETPGGFDYTGADCQGWMREAGFSQTRVEHLAGADSMVIGIK